MKRSLMAVGMATLLLSGCTGAPAPVAKPPAPSVAPTESAPVAEAGSRVPVTCEQLLEPLLENPLFGPGSTTANVLNEGVSVYSKAIEQSGFSGCNFAGPNDASGLHFWVVPDGGEVLAARAMRYPDRPQPPAAVDGPTVQCQGDATSGFSCGINVITAEGYWLDGYFRLYTRLKSAQTLAQVEAAMVEAADGLIDKVDGAGAPLPEWVSPVRMEPVIQCETWKDGDVVGMALGSTTVSGPYSMDSGDGSTALYSALDRVGYLGCGWSDDSGDYSSVYMDVLPGGEWAWTEFTDRPGSAIEVRGADEAMLNCEDQNCTINALARGSWVSLSIQVGGAYDDEDGIAVLEALIPKLPLKENR